MSIVRPLLRAVEVIRVPSQRGGLVTLLRDPERIAVRNVEIAPPLDGALAFMDGRHDAAAISAAMARRGAAVAPPSVDALVRELEDAAMLEGPTARGRRRALEEEFRRAPVREASHAGGAYHQGAADLRRFLDRSCLGAVAPRAVPDRIVGLVAPHMDLWRAAEGYGHAYRALADHLPDEVETIVVLGTCHAGMRTAFAATKKPFATPLGALETDARMLAEIEDEARVDIYAEEYKHKGEHSIEFQCVFLRHLLGPERGAAVRIVPILCGLGRAQIERLDPRRDDEAEAFVGALSEALARRAGRAIVIAGADLAHVGPRFGDARPLDHAGRGRLAARDRASIARALDGDAPGFFDDVTADLAVRRVCGAGPLYTLLRAIEALGARRGELLSYAQHVDPDEGSVVSHASLVFSA